MKSSISPNFRTITALAIVNLMVIGGNLYRVKPALALGEETPISPHSRASPFENIIPIRGYYPAKTRQVPRRWDIMPRRRDKRMPASPGSLVNAIPNSNLVAQVIQGSSGGPINSVNCGFIANSPNYTINLPQRVDYMRITVQAVGGQPTLLVVGPQANDSFCVLGDRGSGLQPEISGVWEPGTYNIFIGDRNGTQHKFTLNISRSK